MVHGSSTPATSPRAFPSARTLASMGGKAALVALAATIPVGLGLRAVLALPDGFLPTSPLPIVIAITVSFTGATAVYALLARLTRKPRRNFLIVGALVYLFSLGGPLSGGLEAQFPGSGAAGAGAAVVMHTLAAAAALFFIGRASR